MSNVLKSEVAPIQTNADIVTVRQLARQWASNLKFTIVDQTKLVTAVSELARNTLVYGGGGTMQIEALREGGRQGVRCTFSDSGPGIPDVELALRDGFTTGAGLGLGLGGAKRLSNQFDIESRPGDGTRITITRWK